MPSFSRIRGAFGDSNQLQLLAQVASSNESMTEEYELDRLNDFHLLFPMIGMITMCIVLPVIIILIFKTERMHVKF